MADEVWPAGILPVQAAFSLGRSAPMSPSAANVSPRVTLRPGSLWSAQVQFGLLDERKWGQITAIADRVKDRQRAILLPAFDRPRPAVWISGTPLPPETVTADTVTLKGADTITLEGLGPDLTQLGPGDRFSVSGRLYRIMDANPLVNDGAGRVTVTFAPPLREDVLTGDAVRLRVPQCRMFIASALPLVMPIQKPMRTAFALEFIEADVPGGSTAFTRTINLFDFLANTVMPDNIGAP